jgi:hypothetical protein
MPSAPRSNKKAEEIFGDIMGEPRNVSKKISKTQVSKNKRKENYGDQYGNSKAAGTGEPGTGQLGNNDEV